ncbi:NAD-dependent epimerase/dehydratase family protein [Seongchinamella sediminis]|uniref:NAD-dependent epimerase/dehydratase family protein n=1 Tax=Seongchinamella sediminis TaxID=2283635 RepID=A0A3L7DZZ7_9GAMM|nr:NAD(P)-dependent oxidoreductase [Seongchinamella sediminis]RLQ22834.1 NAD-dependent epimerase/dehydratase family protein [Seongchinamella sediminis]
MPVEAVDLTGRKLLITGPTGQVALPVVAHFAAIAEVYALARYSKEEDRKKVEDMGATAIQADLARPETLDGIPADIDYVLNFAVVKTGDFDYDLAANAEGVGHLMQRCASVRGFLHFSSTAVYEYAGHEPRSENSPLGDNHRVMFPTYSIAKIAAETVCRFVAHSCNIPTTIARLSVPYGDNGGWMYYHLLMMQQGIPIELHPEQPNYYNPLHVDDYIDKIPYLLAAASSDVTTVNFGGSQQVSIEQWCEYLSELTGLEPVFADNVRAFGSLAIDTEKMHRLIGPTRVDWRDGIRSQVEHLAPELLKPAD